MPTYVSRQEYLAKRDAYTSISLVTVDITKPISARRQSAFEQLYLTGHEHHKALFDKVFATANIAVAPIKVLLNCYALPLMPQLKVTESICSVTFSMINDCVIRKDIELFIPYDNLTEYYLKYLTEEEKQIISIVRI